MNHPTSISCVSNRIPTQVLYFSFVAYLGEDKPGYKGEQGMGFNLPEWGQLITLFMIAVALGMDAFSLGIGLGMKRLTAQQVVLICGIIGFFHILFPLTGMAIGEYLSPLMGEITTFIGGGILLFIGGSMLVDGLRGQPPIISSVETLWSILLLSLSVSLDSLSAGLSLGFFAADPWLTGGICGLVGGLMSSLGLLLGSRIGGWVGEYGEAVGGTVLLALGLKFLL